MLILGVSPFQQLSTCHVRKSQNVVCHTDMIKYFGLRHLPDKTPSARSSAGFQAGKRRKGDVSDLVISTSFISLQSHKITLQMTKYFYVVSFIAGVQLFLPDGPVSCLIAEGFLSAIMDQQ